MIERNRSEKVRERPGSAGDDLATWVAAFAVSRVTARARPGFDVGDVRATREVAEGRDDALEAAVERLGAQDLPLEVRRLATALLTAARRGGG